MPEAKKEEWASDVVHVLLRMARGHPYPLSLGGSFLIFPLFHFPFAMKKYVSSFCFYHSEDTPEHLFCEQSKIISVTTHVVDRELERGIWGKDILICVVIEHDHDEKNDCTCTFKDEIQYLDCRHRS